MIRRSLARLQTAAAGVASSYPPATVAAINKRLSLAGYQAAYVEVADRLRVATKERKLLQEAKDELDSKAEHSPDAFAKGMFGFLAGHQIVLFYWVYVCFDWNLVEPITYLLSYSVVWLSTLCWFSTGKEYTWDNCRDMILRRKRRALYAAARLDLARMESLEVDIERLAAEERKLRPVAVTPME